MTSPWTTLCFLFCVTFLLTSTNSANVYSKPNPLRDGRQLWFSGRDPTFLRSHEGKPTYNGNNNYHPHGAPSSRYVEQLQRQREGQLQSNGISSGIRSKLSSSSNFDQSGHKNKANEDETYDPFFFFSRSKSPSSYNYNSNNHIVSRPRYHSRYYAPSVLPSSIRSRRNSRRRDYFDKDDFSTDPYNIMDSSNSSPGGNNHRLYETAASVSRPDVRDRSPYNILSKNARLRNDHHRRHHGNKGGNQFLSYDEIFNPNGGEPRPFSINEVELRKRVTEKRGEPWSVQIGTRLHVKDDGKTQNSGRFYVRDERRASRNRYPIY